VTCEYEVVGRSIVEEDNVPTMRQGVQSSKWACARSCLSVSWMAGVEESGEGSCCAMLHECSWCIEKASFNASEFGCHKFG
jgi:hypothetical protein